MAHRTHPDATDMAHRTHFDATSHVGISGPRRGAVETHPAACQFGKVALRSAKESRSAERK
jgi:hypothetical protein